MSNTPTTPESRRPVTPVRVVRDRTNVEMHGFGLLMAAILLVVVLPLLPFLAVGWLLWRASVLVRRSVSGNEPGRPGDDVRRRRQARRRAQGR
jgi:hypothetical protein